MKLAIYDIGSWRDNRDNLASLRIAHT